MPETKQVGFRCHAPNQERGQFHSRNGLAQPPTAWPLGRRGSPPSSHAPQGKPLKTRWPFWDWPLTEERKQNLGCYRGRGSRRPLPQHRRTQYDHNQKWPLLGQRAAQEIVASAPAWGSGHNTSVWVAEQPGPNQVLLGCSPVPEGLAASPLCQGQSPGTSPAPPGRAGRGPQVTRTDPVMLSTHMCPRRPEPACLAPPRSPGRSG